MDPNGVLSHVPGDRDRGRQHQVLARASSKSRSVMDRGTLIRSHVGGRPRLHPALAASVSTGTPATCRRRPSPRRTSARGSPARSGRAIPAMPAFINIGQRFDLGEGEELKAFTTAGFLGSEYGPFNIPFPQDAAHAVRPPAGMTPGRFEDRNKFYKRAARSEPDRPARQRLSARVVAALDGQRASPAQLARGEGLRSLARAEGERREIRPAASTRRRSTREAESRRQLRSGTSAASASAACSRGGSPKSARASSKSRPNTFRSSTGTRTRTATRGS